MTKDLTFSFGRKVTRNDVTDFLLSENIFKNVDEMARVIETIWVNRRHMFTRQVVITVFKQGDNDKMVEHLQHAVRRGVISHCHTYSNSEVPVIVDWLHPSIDVGEDFVKGYLERYFGPVKSWHARRDSRTGIMTGEYVFIMDNEDLAVAPIPTRIRFNNKPVYIWYRTQPRICFSCNKTGHKSSECPNPQFPGLTSSRNDDEISVSDSVHEEMDISKKDQASQNGDVSNGPPETEDQKDPVEDNGENDSSKTITGAEDLPADDSSKTITGAEDLPDDESGEKSKADVHTENSGTLSAQKSSILNFLREPVDSVVSDVVDDVIKRSSSVSKNEKSKTANVTRSKSHENVRSSKKARLSLQDNGKFPTTDDRKTAYFYNCSKDTYVGPVLKNNGSDGMSNSNSGVVFANSSGVDINIGGLPIDPGGKVQEATDSDDVE